MCERKVARKREEGGRGKETDRREKSEGRE